MHLINTVSQSVCAGPLLVGPGHEPEAALVVRPGLEVRLAPAEHVQPVPGRAQRYFFFRTVRKVRMPWRKPTYVVRTSRYNWKRSFVRFDQIFRRQLRGIRAVAWPRAYASGCSDREQLSDSAAPMKPNPWNPLRKLSFFFEWHRMK